MFRSSPSPSSSSHSSTDDLPKHFGTLCTGTHKVHYQPQHQWDFFADADEHPVDLSLVLPHYRARNQPPAHRMSMFVHSRGEIKSTVCRQSSRTPFHLAVHSSSSAPVTLCLPSDFCGKIYLSSSQSKVTLSPGFTNNVISRVRFARLPSPEEKRMNRFSEDGSDEVEIHATGLITLRIWDVVEGAPERVAREAWRKMCRRAISSKSLRGEQRARQAVDWDFLLDD
jgi:hypothetical protein